MLLWISEAKSIKDASRSMIGIPTHSIKLLPLFSLAQTVQVEPGAMKQSLRPMLFKYSVPVSE